MGATGRTTAIIETIEEKIDRLIDRTASIPLQFLLLFLLSLAAYCAFLGADPDLFARVAMGRLIEKLGTIPLQDPFAFTPKKDMWIDHEWLAGYIFYHIVQFGDGALFVFKVAIFGVTFALLLIASKIFNEGMTPNPYLSLICLRLSVIAWLSTVRAQVFTYLGLAVIYLAIAKYIKGNSSRSYLAVIPLYMLVWCNAHGGFVAGLGILAIFTIYALVNRDLFPLLIMLLSLSVTLINPYGLKYWDFIIMAVTMERPHITEWASLKITSADGILMLVLSGGILYSIIVSFLKTERGCNLSVNRGIHLLSVILLAVTAWFAFSHVRFLPLFGITALVFGSLYFNQFAQLIFKYAKRRIVIFNRLAILIWLGFAIYGVLSFFLIGRGKGLVLDYSSYPVNAMEWLYNSARGKRLLVDFNNGSFALWRGYPKLLISLDGRYEEVYTDETFELVTNALNFGSQFQAEALKQINPDYILIKKSSDSSIGYRKKLSSWHRVYEDTNFAIFAQSLNLIDPPNHIPPFNIWVPHF